MFLGDAGYFDKDLGRYRSATAAGLTRVARQWLPHASRVALSVVPLGRGDLALTGSSPVSVS